MALVLTPPTPLPTPFPAPAVFLAGSIEQGQAEDWQATLTKAFEDLAVVVLDPRRDEWDASWPQSIDDPRFRGQVEWELEGQERAEVILMYFAPSTRAPITLLELGLFARSGRVIVCCPPGYWRRGNVEVVCARYGISLVDTLPALVTRARDRLHALLG